MSPTEKASQIGSKRAWFIWCLTALTFGYAFFQRVAPSVMVSELMVEFSISAGVLGTLSALYFYPYVLMQVPLGVLLDRYGARALLTIALTIAGIGSIIFATAETVSFAYIGRVLIGIGSAVGFLSTLAIASKWFPPQRFAFLAGLVMFFGMISGVLAQGPLSAFVETYGWRTALWGLGGFSILLASAIFLFVRNAPEEAQEQDKLTITWRQLGRNLKHAFGSLEVWKVAIVASTMSGPMLALGGLWGPPYLMAAYRLEGPYAATLVSSLLISWAIFAPFSGWLSDRIEKRKPILLSGISILTIATGAITFIPSMPLPVTILILIIIGGSGACMAVSFALARENSQPQIGGAVTGVVNSLTVASGAVLQPGVGYILDKFWNGTTNNIGAPIYTPENFQTGFQLIFASCVVGLLVCFTLKDSSALSR
ncbi:MAG: MFS transporter [Pseudomonadota bacterium]